MRLQYGAAERWTVTELGRHPRRYGCHSGPAPPDSSPTNLAKLAACKRMRARLFDSITWCKKGAASESAILAFRLAATSVLSAERLRGPMARRKSISIASRRLNAETLESVATLSKHSTKPGRTSPFFWTSDSIVMARMLHQCHHDAGLSLIVLSMNARSMSAVVFDRRVPNDAIGRMGGRCGVSSAPRLGINAFTNCGVMPLQPSGQGAQTWLTIL